MRLPSNGELALLGKVEKRLVDGEEGDVVHPHDRVQGVHVQGKGRTIDVWLNVIPEKLNESLFTIYKCLTLNLVFS